MMEKLGVEDAKAQQKSELALVKAKLAALSAGDDLTKAASAEREQLQSRAKQLQDAINQY